MSDGDTMMQRSSRLTSSATVMPHALFLGSSLAGVDRLDMMPTLAADHHQNKSRSIPSLPSLWPLRRHRRPSEEEGTHPQRPHHLQLGPDHTSFELDQASSPPPTHLPLSATASAKNIDLVSNDLAAADPEYTPGLKLYEEEMRRFDRIAFVDIHLFHATVCSRNFLSRL